jgi:hypothetical protein
VVDSDALLIELRGRVAEKPSWGRHDLLVLMAELEGKHTVTEDELDRALRLTMPQMLDLLFNRAPQLAEAIRAVLEGSRASDDGDEDHADRDALRARHSIAVA